jgi:hypothetical protein
MRRFDPVVSGTGAVVFTTVLLTTVVLTTVVLTTGAP